MLRNKAYSEEQYNAFIEIRQKIIRGLHEAGVLFLLGSDHGFMLSGAKALRETFDKA